MYFKKSKMPAKGGGIEVVMTEKKMQIKPYPLGAHRESDSIRFSFVSRKESCGILLYDRTTGRKLKKIPFLPEERIGNVYCKYLQEVDPDKISYQFYQEDEIMPDSHARGFIGSCRYGKVREEKDMKAILLSDNFDWEDDRNPRLPYKDCVGYCMHVRGFTKHASSQVAHRGTFLGIVEKLPYLKESGITTIELQPAYEFLEIPSTQELKQDIPYAAVDGSSELLESKRKLNYWGYKKGYYYAPKAAYASGDSPADEFKTMVKELHKNNMEVVMQFYFPKEVNRGEIAEILRFWVMEYHVDGFHLLGENLPIALLAKDDTLVDTKLWYYYFNTDEIYDKSEDPAYCNLAEYRDDYLYTMRKFLKGDEDMLNSTLYQMRNIPDKMGRIHYMSNYFGLTLMDMVSYDHKHNEENGEENRDGNDYNCSWNCGEEGTSRKKKVVALRMKLLKNAMIMMTFTQSTPLIFMGDEFGNTQYGNNNPYCLDNKTTWLDWKELEKNQELYQFWKTMINLRKEHPILRPEKKLRIMDYIACGYPDLSYHGQNAWRAQLESYYRHVGIMYCGKYAKKDRFEDDDFFYLACNMHWEKHELALPKLPRGLMWQEFVTTGEEVSVVEKSIPAKQNVIAEEKAKAGIKDTVTAEKKEQKVDYARTISARSITVFKSVPDPIFQETQKKTVTRKKKKVAEMTSTVNDRTIF